MRSTGIVFLLFGVLLSTPSSVTATVQHREPEHERPQETQEPDHDLRSGSVIESKSSVFPNQIDVSSLNNMPIVILHPRTPIKLEMLPGDNLASIHQALSPSKILELLHSASYSSPINLPSINAIIKEENREAKNRHLGNIQQQTTVNRPVSVHSDSGPNDPALPRSLMNPHSNNGWFQRFRGSFSNMFPPHRPVRDGPIPLSLPTVNLPIFLPQASAMHGTVTPFSMGSLQQFQSWPWRKLNFHSPSIMHVGDMTPDGSHLSPLRMMFGNHHMNRFRPSVFPHHHFGGDLVATGSAFIPRHIMPPYMPFTRPTPPLLRHKPLFNDVGGLQAASMEISNAFADFTDSKEHGPEVTQKFGSVGHSINTFLKMMGLGTDPGFGGFGGGADLAALDSTPIARSLDFYPGYGNQAHMDDVESLDDIEDFPIFEKDMTEEFMKKMNLTFFNGTSNSEKEKGTISVPNMNKSKMAMIKELMNQGNKPIFADGKDATYMTAGPHKMNEEKHFEQPKVNYKIPPILSTVAPHNRKRPIAIYQHFNPNTKDAPKAPTYAPADPLPLQEEEENPNKLVDEDVVRQWRLVNSGQGYVEKRPVPILDVVQSSMPPESLKVLQKVLSGAVKEGSS